MVWPPQNILTFNYIFGGNMDFPVQHIKTACDHPRIFILFWKIAVEKWCCCDTVNTVTIKHETCQHVPYDT